MSINKLAWSLVCWSLLAVQAIAVPPYKALIVDGQNSHDWKNTTPVLKKILEDSGLFSVDVATSPAKGQDMSGFKPNFSRRLAIDCVVTKEDLESPVPCKPTTSPYPSSGYSRKP